MPGAQQRPPAHLPVAQPSLLSHRDPAAWGIVFEHVGPPYAVSKSPPFSRTNRFSQIVHMPSVLLHAWHSARSPDFVITSASQQRPPAHLLLLHCELLSHWLVASRLNSHAPEGAINEMFVSQ
jgi:hypothetical protein